MNENPYTPPAAPVGDASKAPPAAMPAPVLVAVVLLCVGMAFDLLNLARMIPMMNTGQIAPLFWLLALVSLALNAVLAWKIARGRNWARVVLLVLQIIVLGNLLRTLLEQHGFTIFPSETLVLLFLRPVLALVAIVLVFGPGRAWFAPR